MTCSIRSTEGGGRGAIISEKWARFTEMIEAVQQLPEGERGGFVNGWLRGETARLEREIAEMEAIITAGRVLRGDAEPPA